MSKISIRFSKDHKVRAVWDHEVLERQAEEDMKWLVSLPS